MHVYLTNRVQILFFLKRCFHKIFLDNLLIITYNTNSPRLLKVLSLEFL